MSTHERFSIRLICKNPACRRPFGLPDKLRPTDLFEDLDDADAFMKAVKAKTLQSLREGEKCTTRLGRQAFEVLDRGKLPVLAVCDQCRCVVRIREARYIVIREDQ